MAVISRGECKADVSVPHTIFYLAILYPHLKFVNHAESQHNIEDAAPREQFPVHTPPLLVAYPYLADITSNQSNFSLLAIHSLVICQPTSLPLPRQSQ